MGAYQIVGSTLAAAKKALGLSGSERMTPELQDQLGEHILQTQGTAAWKGYSGPREPTANTRASTAAYDPRSDTPTSGRPKGSELAGAPPQYALTVRHPPNPTVGIGGTAAMPKIPQKKPKNWLQVFGEGVGGIGQGGTPSPGYDVPPTPGAARTETADVPVVDAQRADMRRQQLAYLMSRLNQGTLF
jgi:hypothetical protein